MGKSHHHAEPRKLNKSGNRIREKLLFTVHGIGGRPISSHPGATTTMVVPKGTSGAEKAPDSGLYRPYISASAVILALFVIFLSLFFVLTHPRPPELYPCKRKTAVNMFEPWLAIRTKQHCGNVPQM